jgi:Nif-specific regulatory protein
MSPQVAEPAAGTTLAASLKTATDALLNEELEDGLYKLLESLCALLDAEAGSILLVDRASKQLFFAVATGEKRVEIEKLRIGELEGVAGECLRDREAIIVNDVTNTDSFSGKVDKKSGFQTQNLLACPLVNQEYCFGVLEVINKNSGSFTDCDQQIVQIFANTAALAIWQSSKYARCFSALALDVAETGAGSPMIGKSEALQKVKDLVPRVSKSDAPILITGESGVGKEVLAKLIWKSSNRARRVFSAVNCAAIPESLIESELFGHEKGAFTGAHTRRIGRFEAADKGTLFLDEIGELPLEMQAKLLRVLQEMEVTRIGSTKPVKVDVRIIAATNRDLKEAVAAKTFREDLYYRLNVIICHLPALRDRPGDIEDLTLHFIAQFNETMGRAVEGISPKLKERLGSYAWPGNIRELRNTIERLMVLCDSNTLDDESLPANIK